ncbi:MAG: GspE/PulE family protein [Planctomycetota bacterium]|jgi:type IV pilus assembly protein PilB
MARKRKKLGEILREWGTVTEQQVEQGLSLARGGRKRIGEALVEASLCKEVEIAKALAAQFDMEFINLDKEEAQNEIDLSLIPEDLVKKHLVLPMGTMNGRLKLVIHDPMDLELLDLLRFRLNREIETAIAPKSAIKSYIDGKTGSTTSGMFSDESLVTESVDVTMDRSVDTSVDITAGEVLRYRIDGVCHVRDNLPKRMQPALLARLKLMAGMNIAERRVPQDGRIMMPVDAEQIDFRVSACPAYHGESIVLRILRPESVKVGLENLGFERDDLDRFNRIIRRPNGIFLVTGPTGSGKTTTLYSALDVLNRPDRKIITAEDPVEYNFTGINQCQVREPIGLTFSAILRAMLRQAPNIVLVGEIRDREVADIAIQAALTGHLVFSTLHTNDAPSAITRLLDMGVKPFLVASAIQAIMGQRLIRILCEKCKESDPDPDRRLLQLVDISEEEQEENRICRPVGCGHCGNIGFHGRKGIFELMQLNPEVRELAFNQGTIGEIRDAAVRSGMRTLLGDGKIKILRGDTTPDEVARFAQAEATTASQFVDA